VKIEYMNFDGRDRPYSQAIKAGGFVYTSGASMGDPGDDIDAQTTKTLDHLANVLKQAGTDMQHVVKASVFLADIGEWGRFNEIWKRYFPTNKPCRTTTQVGKFGGTTKIEIDFVAALPD
jgi:2-iminobutanoate/2-iminopropanoate deaminase